MEIPNITSPNINVREIDIPQVITANEYYTSTPLAPPVVVNIGVPIVDVPGCVEAHEAKNKSKTVGSDDDRGLVTYCDAGVPSYNPINFEPNQIVPTRPSGVDTRQPKAPEAPDLPIPKTPPATAKVDCPTPAQQAKEPVGTYIEGFRRKVTDYQLVGNQCIQITEPVPLPEQIIAGLPAAGTVVTTSSIAVVATASALMAKPLADILLKVIKPTVKKVMKKIAAIRGKSVPVLSVRDRQDLQRERTQAIRALRSVLKPKG
ncbi:hypothetical cyanophage protein [Synechococcus phage S-RSM4]|uniref:Hypothetical cyanophage protein n=1 Tax=Synechococcus phage S-RSM4 TaxID=555387 RepID=C7BV00_9CAUD|nr:hypothetical cyanophage protein [Synechococcus phage S-RSM4]CAR63229.1 hypothetical cyanophage protein [Synechococcus phage S-RSM4]